MSAACHLVVTGRFELGGPFVDRWGVLLAAEPCDAKGTLSSLMQQFHTLAEGWETFLDHLREGLPVGPTIRSCQWMRRSLIATTSGTR